MHQIYHTISIMNSFSRPSAWAVWSWVRAGPARSSVRQHPSSADADAGSSAAPFLSLKRWGLWTSASLPAPALARRFPVDCHYLSRPAPHRPQHLQQLTQRLELPTLPDRRGGSDRVGRRHRDGTSMYDAMWSRQCAAYEREMQLMSLAPLS